MLHQAAAAWPCPGVDGLGFSIGGQPDVAGILQKHSQLTADMRVRRASVAASAATARSRVRAVSAPPATLAARDVSASMPPAALNNPAYTSIWRFLPNYTHMVAAQQHSMQHHSYCSQTRNTVVASVCVVCSLECGCVLRAASSGIICRPYLIAVRASGPAPAMPPNSLAATRAVSGFAPAEHDHDHVGLSLLFVVIYTHFFIWARACRLRGSSRAVRQRLPNAGHVPGVASPTIGFSTAGRTSSACGAPCWLSALKASEAPAPCVGAT